MNGFISHPVGHWSAKNMRVFLETFAKNRNMDPLLPETWYNITRDAVMQAKVLPPVNFQNLLFLLLFIFVIAGWKSSIS
jgi:hypothetical protein